MQRTERRAQAPAGIRIRTCIATRVRAQDTELLRVVIDPDRPHVLLPDPQRRLPGRGAWLTPTVAAFDVAEKRRAFSRALRVSTAVDTEAVRTWIHAQAAQPRQEGHEH